MKKIFAIFAVLTLLVSAGFLSADSLQPIPFPFIGKWQPSEDPALIEDNGFQDVQNVRKIGKRFKGIGGHSIINATSISAYPYFLNGFHFYKDQPQESHVIVSAANSTVSPTASYLYRNTTAIPGTGAFSATTLHTDAAAGVGRGRFSMAPAGNMVYSNGAETLIWGGSEIEAVSFLSHNTTLTSTNTLLTSPRDYSDAVRNTLTTAGNLASIDAASNPVFFVGFFRPIRGVKIYVHSPNTTTSTLTVSETNSVTAEWFNLSVTDNTSVGGKSLAQTGTVTWTTYQERPRYMNGLSLYWYQFTLSAGTASIYYLTVDSAPQPISNIWDGTQIKPAQVWRWDGTTHIDYTDDVIDELTSTYLDASSMSSSYWFVVGFNERVQAMNFSIKTGSENSASTTQMEIQKWGGAVFAAVSALADGTATGTVSLSKSGVAAWYPPTEGYEFKTVVSNETPLYYYRVKFGSALDADVKISEIRGIPYPKNLTSYSFSESFQNRLFLFSEFNGDKNRAIYSGANTPDIFNGSDSSYLYFGDKTELIAAKPLYNVFRTFAADQLIVAKKNETWRVSGDGPTNWVVNKVSGNVGCTAPLSMVACEVSDGAEDGVKRQVAIWQSDKGFVLSDGAAVIPISKDIRCYFDPNDSRYIPASRQSKTVAWYDPSTRSYKALISSGASATAHNVELEYSLESKEWTKIYRVDGSGADPLQSGFQVFDTNGVGYTYGGNTKGFLYRLENGATFAGTAITNKIQTKDLILDAQIPLFRKSTVKFLRTAHKKKSGTVTVTHYGDQVLTVSGSSNQAVPSAFSTATAPYNTQSCLIGPFLFHSFLFTSVSSVADGMELTGLAIYAEPYTAMR